MAIKVVKNYPDEAAEEAPAVEEAPVEEAPAKPAAKTTKRGK